MTSHHEASGSAPGDFMGTIVEKAMMTHGLWPAFNIFKNIKIGLQNHLSVCVPVCIPLIAFGCLNRSSLNLVCILCLLRPSQKRNS
jgi:hypothetical protein